jgi:hypothetical protein
MVIGIVSIAGAVPYTWVDNYNPNPDKYIGWFRSYSYTHDLTDNTPVPFTVGQDSIDSYSLKVRLYDDGGYFDFGEIAYIDQPGILGGGLYDFSKTFDQFGWTVAGIFSLNTFGQIDITIKSLFGDFYFDYSELTVRGNNQVPEPSTMLLLLSGFMGIAGVRRMFN